MKTFLATYKIIDGEHEHRDYGLINANNIDEAMEYAESQEHDAGFIKANNNPTFFDYGDGTTASRCRGIVELTPTELNVIISLGIANYMNEE